MTGGRPGGAAGSGAGLLLDTNVLVLMTVGAVNPRRIAGFKRTSNYAVEDYLLLEERLPAWRRLCSLPHILAEVSNLTDLGGAEYGKAREELKRRIEMLEECEFASAAAAGGEDYGRLGLTDAAIIGAARRYGLEVLTDDLDLYVALWKRGAGAHLFAHWRAEAGH